MTRVILAESEPIFRYGTKLILEREGFDVVAEVTSGIETLDAVRLLTPDILIMGAGITEPTALDVARELGANRSGTRTILLAEGHPRQAFRKWWLRAFWAALTDRTTSAF